MGVARFSLIPSYQRTKSLLFASYAPLSFMASMLPSDSPESEVEYQKAVKTLNTLQTNASLIAQVREQKSENPSSRRDGMLRFLERCSVSREQMDSLPIIHVAGTQGKGSTCAMVESILRARGLRTGFYSSPHLSEVRERIRLNGEPLSFSAFTSHFWTCYNRFLATKLAHDGLMPFYFAFLTAMALEVFVSERPDVCIVEVGIGGEYDCTNIFRAPRVCGITSLGYDHLDILGDTIEKIAWNKAGIMKENVPCYVQSHSHPVHQVYLERARECKVKELYLIPAQSPYGLPFLPKLSLQGEFQLKNAALAVHLSKRFLAGGESGPGRLLEECALSADDVSSQVASGLSSTLWPGRAQVLERSVPGGKRIVYYLDGAHTPEALECAVAWFHQAVPTQLRASQGRKGIVLNLTGRRRHRDFLQKLRHLELDYVFFCPNVSHLAPAKKGADTINVLSSVEQQQSRCEDLNREWTPLREHAGWSQAVSCFSEVSDLLTEDEAGEEYHVLVTGSLYLVSAALHFLE